MSGRRAYASEARGNLSTGRAVRLGVVTGLLSFSLLLMASWFWRKTEAPTFIAAVRPHDAIVDVWVGDWAPGVTCVLASPWNELSWDAASDTTLHGARASSLPTGLVLYDCWLFNTTDRPVTVSVKDGSLVVTRAEGSAPLPIQSLAPWLAPASGGAPPTGGLATVLRALGADRDTIELPPGHMTRHPVAMSERMSLAKVRSVATLDGKAFRLRQMPEPAWVALTSSPRREDLENLR